MKYHVAFTDAARAQLRAIDQRTALRILRKITDTLDDPYGGDTTALVGRAGERRLRAGDYRVIYTVRDDQLLVRVIRVGHRSALYIGP